MEDDSIAKTAYRYNRLRYILNMTGAEFKNARKASSWTQVQAAARFGVTQGYLSMVERGERSVSSELASRAVEVFEVPGPVARGDGPTAIVPQAMALLRSLAKFRLDRWIHRNAAVPCNGMRTPIAASQHW